MKPTFIDPDWDKEYDEVNEIGDEEKYPKYEDFIEGYRDDEIDKFMNEEWGVVDAPSDTIDNVE